jgi:hypothetical protein
MSANLAIAFCWLFRRVACDRAKGLEGQHIFRNAALVRKMGRIKKARKPLKVQEKNKKEIED